MPKLYTIGHSNRDMASFIELLQFFQITHLVDVRSIPKSRHVPCFNKETLKMKLNKHKINYQHFADLGGRRNSKADSINMGWHNKSFRGFADYMQTPIFFNALKKLNSKFKKHKSTVIMCAEAVPWRCHRSLIADAEVCRGIKVQHIISKSNSYLHHLTSFASVDKSKRPIKITYPYKSANK